MALITQEVKFGGLGAGSNSLRSSRVRRSARVEGEAERQEPRSPHEASQLSVGSAPFVQSHQQLHHDVSQVAVDQAVNLLRTQVRTRRTSSSAPTRWSKVIF